MQYNNKYYLIWETVILVTQLRKPKKKIIQVDPSNF
jgi:hypothetical protein